MIKILTAFLFLNLIIFVPSAYASEIKINEFLADPIDGENEWVEIYAPGIENLNGFYLQDKNDHEDNKKSRILNDAQHCDNYFIYQYDGDGWLNNNGEEQLFLYDSSDSEIDSYPSFGAPEEGKTVGRFPNGSGPFKENREPTKCAENIEAVATPNPSPTSSPETQSSSTKKASPTPKASSAPKSSPSQSSPSASSSPEVLGRTDISESIAQTDPFASPSPAGFSLSSKPSKKVASIMVGAGSLFMISSASVYLWYKKKFQTENQEKPADEV